MTATQPSVSHKTRTARTRIETTLLDLVRAVNQMTDDDRLVVATVAHLINSGQARLIGAFRDTRIVVG